MAGIKSLIRIGLCLLALQLATKAHGFSLGNLFDRSDKETKDYNVTSIEDYGPVLVKTMQALQYLKAAPGAAPGQGNELVVPYGVNSRAIVRRDTLNSLYISFDDAEVTNTTANWATNTTRVPFLQNVSKNKCDNCTTCMCFSENGFMQLFFFFVCQSSP